MPGFVNSAGGFSATGAAGSTQAATITSVTAGNILLAGCNFATQSTTVTSMVDTAGNSWNAVSGTYRGALAGTRNGQIFWAVASSSGSVTVTMTISAASLERELYLSQWSGLDSDLPAVDGVAVTGTTANPSVNTTVSDASGFLYGIFYVVGSVSAASGWTTTLAQNGDLTEHKVTPGTGTQAINATSTSTNWGMSGVTLITAPNVLAQPWPPSHFGPF